MSAPGWERIDPAYFREDSGTLGVIEADAGLPFAARRVFWLFGVPGEEVRRGDHAHAELRQVLVCVRGSCRIDLESRGGLRETVELSEGGAGLLLDGPVWRTMHHFSADAALMVLCDRPYDEDRVIRTRAEFAAL